MNHLPAMLPRGEVQRRLILIFPEGTCSRQYLTRDIAASTVFAMLYVGAIKGTGRYLGPKHVYKMCDAQALRASESCRIEYGIESLRSGYLPIGKPWYADTTREPIRDETLRQGLIAVGAAEDRQDLPTTSPKPRYVLKKEFASLFDPALVGSELEQAIATWRSANLSQGALARVAVVRAGASKDVTGVVVEFPNGETRRLSPGKSSIITKALIEQFAPRFLRRPAVVWLSESGNKVVAQDDMLARRIGLVIDPSRNLPDAILADLGGGEILLVFVEVVATDGPISEQRREALLKMVTNAGLKETNVAFLTAFLDRDAPALRKAFGAIARNSFLWIASEPEMIIALVQPARATERALHALLGVTGIDSCATPCGY